MTKPAVTLRNTKGSALTYSELDTNFTNLQNATVSLTAGTGGTKVSADLNGNITLVAGSGVTLTGDNTAKTVTINTTGGGDITVNEIEFGSTGAFSDVVAFTTKEDRYMLLQPVRSDPSVRGGSVTLYNNDNAYKGTISILPLTNGFTYIKRAAIEDSYIAYTASGTISPDAGGEISAQTNPTTPAGQTQYITLTGNITINNFKINGVGTPSIPNGAKIKLFLVQPSSGGPYTLTSTMKFAGGDKTLSTAANAVDLLEIWYVNSQFHARLTKNFS
jgi:hypothetical protein